MKATGIVRRIDDLGRIVIPKEIRRTLGLNEGDPMEMFVDEDKVIISLYNPGCIICGGMEEIAIINGKRMCSACIKRIKEQ
jgi:transcriptional pleiotropic regulator of transition state genes